VGLCRIAGEGSMECVSFFQENGSPSVAVRAIVHLKIGAVCIGILVFRATDRAMAMFLVHPQYKGHSR
jgi:hypothetical protein